MGMTRRRHRVTRTPATTCHMKTCAPLLGKDTKPAREQGPNGSETWHRGKGTDEWRDDGGKIGGKKGSTGSKSDGYSDKDKGSKGEARAGARARVKPDTAAIAEGRGISG